MREAVTATSEKAAHVEGVGQVITPYDVPAPALRATDGRASLISVNLDKGHDPPPETGR